MKSLAGLQYTREPLYEYSLIVYPCGDILGKIEEETVCFVVGNAIEPHITLARFQAMESMEETLIRWMRRICSQQESFQLTLNNYSGVPPGTIYLRIQNGNPFKQLGSGLQTLNAYISSCGCPPLQLVTKPRLVIAQLVSKEMYEKALAQYARKSFHASFEVNELLLMKRENPFEPGKKVTVFGLPPVKAAIL